VAWKTSVTPADSSPSGREHTIGLLLHNGLHHAGAHLIARRGGAGVDGGFERQDQREAAGQRLERFSPARGTGWRAGIRLAEMNHRLAVVLAARGIRDVVRVMAGKRRELQPAGAGQQVDAGSDGAPVEIHRGGGFARPGLVRQRRAVDFQPHQLGRPRLDPESAVIGDHACAVGRLEFVMARGARHPVGELPQKAAIHLFVSLVAEFRSAIGEDAAQKRPQRAGAQRAGPHQILEAFGTELARHGPGIDFASARGDGHIQAQAVAGDEHQLAGILIRVEPLATAPRHRTLEVPTIERLDAGVIRQVIERRRKPCADAGEKIGRSGRSLGGERDRRQEHETAAHVRRVARPELQGPSRSAARHPGQIVRGTARRVNLRIFNALAVPAGRCRDKLSLGQKPGPWSHQAEMMRLPGRWRKAPEVPPYRQGYGLYQTPTSRKFWDR